MRDIKFRAWDKNLKRILKVKEIDFEHRLVTLEISELAIKKITFENVELLQYTGLKDKNGKDIYERDIFAHNNHKFEVVWDSTRFIGLDNDRSGKGYCCYVDSHYKDGSSSIEVVGNVYENDLLKGKV